MSPICLRGSNRSNPRDTAVARLDSGGARRSAFPRPVSESRHHPWTTRPRPIRSSRLLDRRSDAASLPVVTLSRLWPGTRARRERYRLPPLRPRDDRLRELSRSPRDRDRESRFSLRPESFDLPSVLEDDLVPRDFSLSRRPDRSPALLRSALRSGSLSAYKEQSRVSVLLDSMLAAFCAVAWRFGRATCLAEWPRL